MNSDLIRNVEEYHAKKQALLNEAFDLKFQDMRFTDDEHKANEIFKNLVKNTKANLNEKFHFHPILYKSFVESSTLYKLLTDMPKGCQQHSHNPCSLPSSWFVKYCFGGQVYIDEKGKIGVFEQEPEGNWRNLKKLREEAPNKEEFDKKLEDSFHFTLEEYDAENIWEVFEFKIENRLAITFIEGVWEQYMLDTLLLAIKEGYSNIQMRNLLPFYEHKKFMDPEEECKMYKRCLGKAQEKDPNFTIGVTFAGLRFWELDQAQRQLSLTYDMFKKYRDIIVGFDLVAEEKLRAAEDFAPMFLEHKKKTTEEGIDFPLLLHGGESLDQHNTNLYDLLLCDSKRIGHGLNLFKHPYLIPKIKEKNICIEVNPLSNQILKYVADLRLHPAIGYHNAGVKISISSDGIGIFQLQTIWDFFVSAVSFEFDLLDLKRVIVNSIETSCVENSILEIMRKDFETKWPAFISKILSNRNVQLTQYS